MANVQVRRKESPLVHTLLVLFSVVMFVPFVWLLLTSFKQSYELFTDPWSLPSSLNLKNFVTAWSGGVRGYFFNSVIVTSVTVAAILLFSSMAGFVFARRRFVGHSLLFLTIVSGFLIPVQVTLVPLYNMFRTFGLLDSRLGLILPYIAYGVPFSVLLLATYFQSIPEELEQAAVIDGCSNVQIYHKIILPLGRPGLVTVLIFQGVWIWNEFLFALVFIRSRELMTLPLGLMQFRGEYIANWPAILAAVVLATVPLFLMFITFQRAFIEGLTAGSVKE